MDPGVTQTEDVPIVVVVSSLVTLFALVITTVWMCWRVKQGLSNLSEDGEQTDEFKLPENTPLESQPTEEDPPDEENEEEETEERNDS